jgi:hypothetical protein
MTQRFGPISADLRNQNLALALAAPAPNPARTMSNLRYSCGQSGGRLYIYDLAGRLVRAWDLAPAVGEATLVWDLNDSAGRKMSAGVYQVVLSGNGMTKTRRIVVCR